MMKNRKTKYSEDEYVYSAVKVSSMSAKLITETELLSFCELGSSKALRERLCECVFFKEDEEASFEELLSGVLAGNYDTLSSFLPDRSPVDILRVRNDAHNVKTAIKCAAAGIEPDPYFMRGGIFDSKDLADMCAKRDFSSLPTMLSTAAEKALEIMDSHASARLIDNVLDRACFDYMRELAAEFGCPQIDKLLKLKTDIVNTVTRLRILKIKNENTAKVLLSDSFVGVGNIPPYKMIDSETPNALIELLSGFISEKNSSKLHSAISEGAGNDRLAAILDTVFLCEALDVCRNELLGISPVISYAISFEYLVKNLRIIACGLDAGKDADAIREELRLCV